MGKKDCFVIAPIGELESETRKRSDKKPSLGYLLLLAAALVAVAGSLDAEQLPPGIPEQPEEYRAEVQRAEMIGAVLYRVDQAAWKATDAVLAMIDQQELTSKTDGWIVSHAKDGSWLVRFAKEVSEGVFSQFDVPFEGNVPGEVVVLDPPARLEGLEEDRFRARQTAIRDVRLMCERAHNTVVVSSSIDGIDGWYVYFLVGTVKESELPLAGHIRILVSPKGDEVIENHPLSTSCLIMDFQDSPGPPEVALGTHGVSDTPNEVHAFLSYGLEIPLMIATKVGVWGVIEGRILLVNPMEDLPEVSEEECRDLLGEECSH